MRNRIPWECKTSPLMEEVTKRNFKLVKNIKLIKVIAINVLQGIIYSEIMGNGKDRNRKTGWFLKCTIKN